MWESIGLVIQKMSALEILGATFIGIPLFLMFVIWLSAKCRWDLTRPGLFKYVPYWHDYKYEADKKRHKDYTAQAEALNKKIDFVIDEISDISLDILKNNVYTPEMPLDERMASGIKYLILGGNAVVKEYIKSHLRNENASLFDGLEREITNRYRKKEWVKHAIKGDST